MRIVGGSLGGRKITVPSRGVRPTSERVREALMSMLGPHWTGRRVLDAFAGSGAFGIEALSRGAEHCTFVEAHSAVHRNLLKTIDTLDLAPVVTVLRGDAPRVLKRLSSQLPADSEANSGFDLLFFDPPYHDPPLMAAALKCAPALARPGAQIVAEYAADDPSPQVIGLLHCVKRRTWGSTGVAIYALQEG